MDTTHLCRRSRVYLYSLIVLFSLVLLLAAGVALAQNSTAAGALTIERPTLLSIGFVWEIGGDDNRNATVTLEYRKKGAPAYQRGLDLLRTENANNPRSGVIPGNKLAGSALLLEPGTLYEFRLTLSDPDNGGQVDQRTVEQTTRPEPQAYSSGRTLYVVPGNGGGNGSPADPFKGLRAAEAAAQPGDLFLLQAGTYDGALVFTKNGTLDRPITYRGESAEAVIIDGAGGGEMFNIGQRQYLYFEKMTFRNGAVPITGSNVLGIAIKESIFRDLTTAGAYVIGFIGWSQDGYICDNTILGPGTFPSQAVGKSGIAVRGSGHVVCHNSIRNFRDDITLAYDLGNSSEKPAQSIDLYNNLLQEANDDGIEADMTLHNIRIFRNKILNVQKGISVQPSYAGPTYIFFNEQLSTLSNPPDNPNRFSPYKFHPMGSDAEGYDYPSGVYLLHNTSVAWDWGFKSTFWHNSLFRNNLIYGETNLNPTMISSRNPDSGRRPNNMDYNGYSHKNSTIIAYDGGNYPTLAAFYQATGNEQHGRELGATVFTRLPALAANTWYLPADYDLTLAAGGAALDNGVLISGLNDGFPDGRPDLGAHERGLPLPTYGPRTGGAAVDADRDGFSSEVDCQDLDAAVYPGAREICDGKDNNCNGSTDEGNVCQGQPIPTPTPISGKAAATNTDLVQVSDGGCRSSGRPYPWLIPLLLLFIGLHLGHRRTGPER